MVPAGAEASLCITRLHRSLGWLHSLLASAACHAAALVGIAFLQPPREPGRAAAVAFDATVLEPSAAQVVSLLPDFAGQPPDDRSALLPVALTSEMPFSTAENAGRRMDFQEADSVSLGGTTRLPARTISAGMAANARSGNRSAGSGSAGKGSGPGKGTGNGSAAGDGRQNSSGHTATFFGLTAGGADFVFVVDMSGSMAGRRFRRARAELRRSIESLGEFQRYFVVFFNHDSYPMPADDLLPATKENIGATNRWIKQAECHGNTFPMRSLDTALSLKPDAVFLLTDGEFDPMVVQRISLISSSQRVPINTIGFMDRAGEPLLKELARVTGGNYRFVK